MRVVLDTSVVVSALLKPMGNERRALSLGLTQKFTLLVSDHIFREYEAVLIRPELKLEPKEVEETLARLREEAVWIAPTKTLAVSPHEPDNRFLECASAGGADLVVTGNQRHFPARFGKTSVVNARQFLELISPEAGRH